jgi:hypothetical protein
VGVLILNAWQRGSGGVRLHSDWLEKFIELKKKKEEMKKKNVFL